MLLYSSDRFLERTNRPRLTSIQMALEAQKDVNRRDFLKTSASGLTANGGG
jgi:hypothetical protein